MENLMPKVAELLDVEIGEEFGIKGFTMTFRLSNVGLEFTLQPGTMWDTSRNLTKLITGEYEIIKKPWKPKDGHRFYYITFYGNLLEDYYECDNTRDITLYKTGNCFKTREEITPEIINKFVKFYKDDTQKFNVLEE